MPVDKGEYWAWIWSQRGWGDSASRQATNSRQLGNETERTVANRFQIAFKNFPEFFVRWSEGAWSLIRAERSWKVRGKCTVEVTVGKSCDLVFEAEFHGQPMELIQQRCYMVSLSFFSERAELHCFEHSAVDLFVRQANRRRQSCSNQGERSSEWRLVLRKFFRRDKVGWMQGFVMQEKRHDR